MANANLSVKDRFVAAVFSGDRQTIAELLDPEFELQQPRGLAYAGVYKGAAGFMGFLDTFMATYEIEILENTHAFLAEDAPDVVVLEFRFRGKLRATGEQFDTSQLEPWYFRNGRILKIRPHWFEMPQLPPA